MPGSDIPERFLHTIWNDRSYFLRSALTLVDGTAVTILGGGEWNQHRGGPDFLNAKIAIDGAVLTGDVEVHKHSSDWHSHEHEHDARYNRVILHVLLDAAEDQAHAPAIPTLSVRDNLSVSREDLWRSLFERLYARRPDLPCFPHNLLVPMKRKRKVIEQLAEVRLDELIGRFRASERTVADRLIYSAMMDALGYSQNRQAFRELAAILPVDLVRTVVSQTPIARRAVVLEALYLGPGGLLPSPDTQFDRDTNEYLLEAHSCWQDILGRTSIPTVLTESDWAFFRIRPLNSPYRRVVLAAHLTELLFLREDEFWSHIEEALKPRLGQSPFWEMHTSYESLLDRPQALLGTERAEALLLNVFVPARLAALSETAAAKEYRSLWINRRSTSSATYLKSMGQELLEGERLRSVGEEQGALYLARNYCEKFRCEECPIGTKILEKGGRLPAVARGSA